jgi:hypothetical protein
MPQMRQPAGGQGATDGVMEQAVLTELAGDHGLQLLEEEPEAMLLAGIAFLRHEAAVPVNTWPVNSGPAIPGQSRPQPKPTREVLRPLLTRV